MKSTQYSEKVLDHFRNPRNVGTLEGENVAVGEVGNPVCGDLMDIYIEVENNRIKDIKFKTFGCGSAIATSSMITEMVKGMTLEEALKVTRKDVADELEGLPPVKMHCSNLAADALHAAIRNYYENQKGKVKQEPQPEIQIRTIKNAEEYLGKGYYITAPSPNTLKDKRILLVFTGDESIDLALKVTEYTGRVILITCNKSLATSSEKKRALKRSTVKILYESEIEEILGDDEVEQVRIHDLDEDDEYSLFIDAIIALPFTSLPEKNSRK